MTDREKNEKNEDRIERGSGAEKTETLNEYYHRMQVVSENELSGAAEPLRKDDRNAEYDQYEHGLEPRNIKTHRDR